MTPRADRPWAIGRRRRVRPHRRCQRAVYHRPATTGSRKQRLRLV